MSKKRDTSVKARMKRAKRALMKLVDEVKADRRLQIVAAVGLSILLLAVLMG